MVHTAAFSTEPWHLLQPISHETHLRDSRGGEGVERRGERGAQWLEIARKTKTGGERCRARAAALFLRAGAPHTKKKKIINQCAK